MSQTERTTTELESTSHVSVLISSTREEVKSRENASSSGAQSARSVKPKRLVSSVTKGQHNRTFFTNTPIFIMPPVGTPPSEPPTHSQHEQHHQPLFLKMRAASHAGQSQHSQASFRGQPRHAPYAGSDVDDSMYSPDVPQLVPYHPSHPSAHSSSSTNRGSTASLYGNPVHLRSMHQPPVPLATYQTQQVYTTHHHQPYPPHFLPPQSYQPQHIASTRSIAGLAHTAPAPLAPIAPIPPSLGQSYAALPLSHPVALSALAPPTLQPPHSPYPPSLSSSSSAANIHKRSRGNLATTASTTSIASAAGATQTYHQQQQAANQSAARLEVLEYLQSPACSLFSAQMQVLGSDLDALIQACGGTVQATLNLLQEYDAQQRSFSTFHALLQAVRSGQPAAGDAKGPNASGGDESKQQDAFHYLPMAPKRSKASRKQAQASRNGGVEDRPLTSMSREAIMARVVEYISAPGCSIFAHPNPHQQPPPSAGGQQGSGANAAANAAALAAQQQQQQDVGEIKIHTKDLEAMVNECGGYQGQVLIGYLDQINGAIEAIKRKEMAAASVGATTNKFIPPSHKDAYPPLGPFKTFGAFHKCVLSLHSKTQKLKMSTLQHLNQQDCKLFSHSYGGNKSHNSPEQKESMSASGRARKSTTSLMSDSTLGHHQTFPPNFTLHDMDRLWIDSHSGANGDEILHIIHALENEGHRITTTPYLAQLIDLVRSKMKFAVQQKRVAEEEATARARKEKQAKKAARTAAANAKNGSNVDGSKDSSASTSSLLSGAHHHHANSIDDSIGGSGGTSPAHSPVLGPHSPSGNNYSNFESTASFDKLTKRAQRFVVELTAFLRSPRTKVLSHASVTAVPKKKGLWDERSEYGLVETAMPQKNATIASTIIDGLTAEDFVELMRIAGDKDLLIEEEQAALAAATQGANSRANLHSSDGSNESALLRHSNTNRALFFLTSLNTAITLPKPTMQPLRDWASLLGAVQYSQQESVVAQNRLFERLTSAQCKLFGNMQVRRVPDSYSYSSQYHFLLNEEDGRDEPAPAANTANTSVSNRSPNSKGVDSSSVVGGGGSGGSNIASSPTGGNVRGSSDDRDGDEILPASERLLYISSLDMHRLFFESTAGMDVENYLDQFEAAGRTFFDFNGLVFGVKVAHLQWLSQIKSSAAASHENAEGNSATTSPQAAEAAAKAQKEQEEKDRKAALAARRAEELAAAARAAKQPRVAATHNNDAGTSTAGLAESDVSLEAYKQAAMGSASTHDSEVVSPSGKAQRTVSTQTTLPSAPVAASPSKSATKEDKSTPTKIKSSPSEDSPAGKMSSHMDHIGLSLTELGVHLRSTTVQSLLFAEKVIPLPITEHDLHKILATTHDIDGDDVVLKEAEIWHVREEAEKEREREKEIETAIAAGMPPPPPYEKKEFPGAAAAAAGTGSNQGQPAEPMSESYAAVVAAATLGSHQQAERQKCALILDFLQQMEAPAISGQGARQTAVQAQPIVAQENLDPSHPALNRTAVKFTSVAQLCDALYLEYALHRSKQDTLAFLRHSTCRLLPEGTSVSAVKGDGASSAASSKLQNMITGGPNGTISVADVDTLFRLAKAGLYTLPILQDLNNEHLRAFDLDSLISMVMSSHASNITRIKSQKFMLLTHLSGNKMRCFLKPVRVTDCHLDLLLTATRNSGSASLYYLHQLSLWNRSFNSMNEVIVAMRYMITHQVNYFKNRVKQQLSSPMCIVMNKQKERQMPTDSVIDRLWDVQQAGIDALAHIQALHADAQGFASYPELITAIGANQASVRSSQTESEKWMLFTHLASPLCTLFSYPLYDITITPKHLESLMSAGGNSASVVLFHIEHLDVDPPKGCKNAFDGMPPLIKRIAAGHQAVRAQDERLQSFLNSRVCRLFRDSKPGEVLPIDDVAIDRLLNEGGVTASAALAICQGLNNAEPTASFRSLDPLIKTIQNAARSDPRIPQRALNSLNNFGQPRELVPGVTSIDLVSLPSAEPVRLAFPGANGFNDAPAVNGLFYSDGSMPLDAEEGIAGKFVVDPTQLYDEDGSSPQVNGYTSLSRRGSGRITLSRPASARAVRAVPNDPFEAAKMEADREMIVEYLNLRSNLFQDVNLDNLEITADHLDDAVAIAGSAKNVLIEFTRMDATAQHFKTFEELLNALQKACRASRAMERSISSYRNPEEEMLGDQEADEISSPNGKGVPSSVRQADVSSNKVLVLNTADGSTNGTNSGPPSLFRKSSVEQRNAALQRALSIATAHANGDADVPKEFQFTDEDRHALRTAIRDSQLLSKVQAEAQAQSPEHIINLHEGINAIECNQILVIGGGVENTVAHLKRLQQAGRQVPAANAIAPLIETSKESGLYASTDDFQAIETFLADPQNMYLKAYLNSTEIPINFRDLPRTEIDLWCRSCGGMNDLIYYLTFIAKYNRTLALMSSNKLDEAGQKIEPVLLIPHTPAELLTAVHEMERAQKAQNEVDARQALFARVQARSALKSFLVSEHCNLFTANVLDSIDPLEAQLDAIIDAVTPNSMARTDVTKYRATEADVEAIIERLNQFESAGRKFSSMDQLVNACKAAYLQQVSPADNESISGAHVGKTQQKIVADYLLSEQCGLLSIDAKKKLAAATPQQWDGLVSQALAVARRANLPPLAMSGAASLPRFITAISRLELRSPSHGEEFQTVDSIIQALTAMVTEEALPSSALKAVINFLVDENKCFVFSNLPEDAHLAIHNYVIDDLIRLCGGYAKAMSTLGQLSACGVKVNHLTELQWKIQRVISFGFFCSSRDFNALNQFFRSPKNKVLVGVQLSEQDCDKLLQYSGGKGSSILIEDYFQRLMVQHPSPATSADQLAQRLSSLVSSDQTAVSAAGEQRDAEDKEREQARQEEEARFVESEKQRIEAEAKAAKEERARVAAEVAAAEAAHQAAQTDAASAATADEQPAPTATSDSSSTSAPAATQLTDRQRHDLTSYLLDDSTLLFEDGKDIFTSPAERRKQVVDAASDADLFALVQEGDGIQNLLGRLTYLDTTGERFTSVTSLLPAVSKLHHQIQPSEEDRNRLIEFLGAPETQLFEVNTDEEQSMEISAAELDAMILCKNGIEPCLNALKVLESEGWRVTKLNSLLQLLLGKSNTGAKQIDPSNHVKQRSISMALAPIEVIPSGSRAASGRTTPQPSTPQPIPAPAATDSSSSSSITAASAETAATTPPTVSVPAVDGIPTAIEDASDAHQQILNFLSQDHISLFAPLAETGAELEVTDEQLNDMIASTNNNVELTIAALALLDAQKRGFTSLAELAEAVKAKFVLMQSPTNATSNTDAEAASSVTQPASSSEM